MRAKSRFLLSFQGFFGVFMMALLLSSPAFAKNAVKSTDRYDLYSGGIHFVSGNLTVEKGQNGYNALFAAAPHGFLGKLLPWSAEITVEGGLKGNTYVPKQFVNLTAWKGVPATASLYYNNKGELVRFVKDSAKRGKVEQDIDKKLALNTVDVLTAVLQTMSKPLDKTCDSSYPVFDGKRRFNITLKNPKNVVLEKTRYNSFEGDAVECILDLEPIAGFKEKKSGWNTIDADQNKKTEQPTVWFGVDKSTGTVKLVKARLKTDFGMVLAHLANK